MSSMDFLAPIPAVMIRQKCQVLEQLCAVCEKKNEYKVSAVMTSGDTPDDDVFKSLPTLLYAQEESTLMCRICCGRNREFTMNMNGVNAQGQTFTYIQLERPFKCSILCLWMLFNPQELLVKDGQSQPVGRVVVDWRCIQAFCFPGLTFWMRVEDAAAQPRFFVRVQYPTLCNGCRNCLAPTCFNKVFNIDIFNADESAQVGSMRAVWPGCKFPRCVSDATNLIVDFPQGVSGNDKALLLGAIFLIEYMYFEKNNQDQ